MCVGFLVNTPTVSQRYSKTVHGQGIDVRTNQRLKQQTPRLALGTPRWAGDELDVSTINITMQLTP